MENRNIPEEGREASISRLRRVSGLWLIPIVTLLVGLWMVYDNWANQGPLITISFGSANGLEEGKTKIKSRNIHIGDVLSVDMEDGFNGVLVTARMKQQVRELLVEGSNFWVVQPEIGFSGISGIETLLGGQYIEFSPGSSANQVDHFEGQGAAPVTPPGTQGLHITLNSLQNFSYGVGHPVLYNGLEVGKIEDAYFNSSERMMYYNAFIQAPFHDLVTQNTRFWDVSGINAELSQDGISLETAGLAALILGGVAFGLPDGESAGAVVTERAYFLVHHSRAASQERQYEHAIPFVLLVDNNNDSLKVGSSVTLRGVQVGKVTRAGHIREGRSLLDQAMKIPIRIEIDVGRLGFPDTQMGKSEAYKGLMEWLAGGMTANLKSSNPILGQYIVELTQRENFEPQPVLRFEDNIVIPVVAQTGLDNIFTQVDKLLGQLNQLEIAEIGSSVDALLEETRATMQQVKELALSGEILLNEASHVELVNSLSATILEFRALAESYGRDSPAQRELNQLLETMVDVLSGLEPLVIELNNRPNGLIFTGRAAREPEPEPQSKQP